jgi:type I restriction enzyme S subunit
LVRSQNVFERHFDSDGLAYITDEQAGSLGGVVLQCGDVLLNITGDGVTFGRACMVPEYVRPACVNQHVAIIRADPSLADPGYLLAYLTHPNVKHYIASFNSGGSRRAVTKAHIESFRVPLPPLPEQRGIAATLGALDDKIQSNRRAQKTASELIDALARHMLTAHPTRTARLAELVDFNTITRRPDNPANEVIYVDIASVSPGRVDSVVRTTWERAPSRARRGVSDGDVIYSTVRPGRRAFSVILDPDKQTVVSTGFAVMSPGPSVGTSLLTSVAGSTEFASYLESVAHGSAYPAVSVEAMGNYMLEVPVDQEVIQEFEVATMPLRRRSQQMDAENIALEALRDTLLPELLSGRIRVPEAVEAIA